MVKAIIMKNPKNELIMNDPTVFPEGTVRGN
jgi:hypothetical protein